MYEKIWDLVSDYTVVDTETTGLSPTNCDIIEIAALRVRNGVIADSFHSYISISYPVPKSITKLTGITPDMLADAPEACEVMPAFLDFIGNDVLIGHNFSFDISFINNQMWKAGMIYELENDYIDTLYLSKKVYAFENYKLVTIARNLCVCCDNAHNALDDCKTTNSCYLKTMSYIKENSLSLDSCTSAPLQRPKFEHVKTSEIKPTCQPPKHSALLGSNIVFTGTLSLSRQQAMQFAVNAGAVLKSAVSAKTDYLVVGVQDKTVVGDDGLSGKEELAQRLILEKGAKIKIIDENDFLRLLTCEVCL